jgi:hypothetical protein
MNYWLHRISYEAELSYALLDRGFLTIGFSDFTDSDFIDKVIASDLNYFDNQFKELWGRLPRIRHNLWRFLSFKAGDIVIVPSWGTFYVCEVLEDNPLLISETYSDDLKTWGGKKVSCAGNHLYRDIECRNIYDLGFARKVKVIHKKISRSQFADSRLTSRMKIRQTNASINDLKVSIEKSIENYIKNKPIHLHSIIIDNTAKLFLEIIKNELNPDKFEKLVKAYFNKIGANEVTIPAKNTREKEGDADIIAVFENIRLIIYTQVKFHKGTIDEWGTQQILDYKTNKESIDDGYNKIAWVITSANTFNEEAERIATENEMQLIDGLEFSKMLLNAGISMLNTSL